MRVVTLFISACSCVAIAAHAGAPLNLKAEPLVLPGGPAPVGMDYLAYDDSTKTVWVPAGNTGKVDVVDSATRQIRAVDGFPTAQRGNRTVGPSSATAGAGVVYVGNRADSSVCAVDAKSLRLGQCAKLESMPDGIVYVPPTKEVWVTAPRDKALIILDVASSTPKVKGKVQLEGQPEGYAVDAGRGIFYTNYEDKNLTLAIDVRTRQIKSQWQPKCGEAGPRGISLDDKAEQLFVACTDRVSVLSTKNGALLSQTETGAGVDNPDYLPSRHMLYIASGKAAKLSIFSVSAKGTLEKTAEAETSAGSRVVVADAKGNAYVSDSAGGRLLFFKAPP